MKLAWLVVAFTAVACSTPSVPDAGGDPFDAPGRFAAGNKHLTITVDGGRVLPVEVWYPATGATDSFPVENFEDGARRAQLASWISQAPEACTPRSAHSTKDAPPIEGALPLLVFSHCTECFRFSLHSVAERLATHGYVVAAADHVTNTRFDATAQLNDAFLAVRAADVSGVIDHFTSASAPVSIDSKRIGVFGHSFGAVTTAKVVELDSRVKGGLLIAAPADSAILNLGGLMKITKPLSYLLAVEDGSVGFFGNEFIRDNFRGTAKPTWLVEVDNAGHWSFSDIAMLGGSYKPGCGESTREVDGGAFTYLDNDVSRSIAQRMVTAWARFTLDGDESAAAALSTWKTPGVRSRKR